MAEEPYLLVSLEEDKAKTLAQVLSNDTARKILDFLSKRDHATETEISKDMKIPLSTAHYNLDLLVKAGLVSDENFTYSEKGKQIVHYALSNKYVIIAPRKSDSFLEKLKNIIPVALVIGSATAAIRYLWTPFSSLVFPPQFFESIGGIAKSAGDESARIAGAQATPMIATSVHNAQPIVQSQEFAVWFLFGSVFALLVHFVWAEILVKKLKK